MNRTIYIAALAIACTLPRVSAAWSGYNQTTVTIMTIYQNGMASPPGVLVQFTGGTGVDSESCAHSGNHYAWLDWSGTGQPDGKALYATLLAAQLAGRQVGIGLNGCNSAGNPLIYGIDIYPQ